MARNSFGAFGRRVKQCDHCAAHLPLGPNPVFQAHPDAHILLVGQAPGIRVHKSSTPFTDPSGDRLRDWMGVDSKTFYNPKKIAILPMGFCYPGSGERGDLPPRPECAEKWREEFLDYLPNIQLTLLMGQYAIKYHLGKDRKKTLTDTVRQWQDYWPDYLALPHPSPRNNIWLKKNPWFVRDVLPELKNKIRTLL